jgi:hypothetical protein
MEEDRYWRAWMAGSVRRKKSGISRGAGGVVVKRERYRSGLVYITYNGCQVLNHKKTSSGNHDIAFS